MRFLKKLNSFFDGIIDGMAFLAGLLLLFTIFSICYEVLIRYFLMRPSTWSVEITEYILLYITFLGAPWLLKQKGHVKVDVVLNMLNIRTQRILNLITSLLGAIICLVLFWFGVLTTADHFMRKIPVIKSLEVPKFILLAVIPFGSLLLCIQFIRQIVAIAKNLKEKHLTGEKKVFETGL